MRASPAVDAAILAALPIWPLCALDVEASGLGVGSYPIEVGVTVWRRPGEPARSWSRLVRPTAAWLATGVWDPAAEALHGIAPIHLARGVAPAEALAGIEARVGSAAMIADGGVHDLAWMMTLAAAAGGRPRLQSGPERLLGAIRLAEPALGERRVASLVAIDERLEGEGVAHRAGPDSRRFARALALAYGRDLAFEEDFG